MPGYIIAVLAICIISSATFTVVSFKKTLINLYFKTFSSVMFTILGLLSLYTLISHSLELSDNRLIGGFFMVLGLITCMVGDIILGLPKLEETKNSSTAVIIGGAFWFFVGHVLYCTTLIVLYGISPWVIAVILPLCALYAFGNKKITRLQKPYRGRAAVFGYRKFVVCPLFCFGAHRFFGKRADTHHRFYAVLYIGYGAYAQLFRRKTQNDKHFVPFDLLPRANSYRPFDYVFSLI